MHLRMLRRLTRNEINLSIGNLKFFLICGMNYELLIGGGHIFQIITLADGTTLELEEMLDKFILTQEIRWKKNLRSSFHQKVDWIA